MKHFLEILHHKLIKLLDLIDVPAMFLGSYTLAQYKDVLGTIGIIITISYTLWKWRKEWLEARLKNP